MFVSVQFKLEFENKENKEKVLSLMRLQSSVVRFIYNRLKEGKTKTEAYQLVKEKFNKEKFNLPAWYVSSAAVKANSLPRDKTVVFGGKVLFEKFCKNHLQGKAREKLKKEWKEKRQGNLISVGSKHETHKGNLCMRFEQKEENLYLRITTGEREFIYAKVKREPSNSKDKWNTFLAMLWEAWKSKNYFPYTVELKLRDGEIYGSVSFEVPTPEVWLTKEYGVIAIDTNASPLHLALAEVSLDGNLLSYQTISLHELIGLSKNRKDYEEWLLAHKVVQIAKEKGKAIAVEDLKKVNRGYRRDGKAKLRKRLHHWNFKGLLSKIERTARLSGIEVIKVNPAFTSVIGALKYAPQLGIDKDIAGAYVIFKEEVPENYLKRISDKEYLEYAIHCYEEREKELTQRIKKETNQYKRNAINSELKQVEKAKEMLLKRLKSLQELAKSSCEGACGNSRFRKGTSGWNPKQEEVVKATSYGIWQVLKVAFALPILGKLFTRDFSSLKPILVEGKWNRRAIRLVPSGFGGTALGNTG